jgi:hypothetical protein
MKKNILLFGIVFFLISCKDSNEGETDSCHSLSTIAKWTTIDFKDNYTIQIPKEFIGPGVQYSFEGNYFYDTTADGKIQLSSGYGGSTYIMQFGPVLPNPVPKEVLVMNNSSKSITLDQIETFCSNSEIVGYLFYSNEDISRGRLYWKNRDNYQAMLEIDFYLSELETVNKIIESIKQKKIIVDE